MTYMKDFENWHELKQRLDGKGKLVPYKKRQIWWTSLGVNIGHEIDGKHQSFERPVLVIKKINASSAFVVPLTSTIREGDSRLVSFEINGKKSSAAIAEARKIDVRRFRRIFKEKMSNKDFTNIVKKFKAQFD